MSRFQFFVILHAYLILLVFKYFLKKYQYQPYHRHKMAKTLEEKMGNYSLGYAFVRTFFVIPAITFFYRNINVIGAKEVPDKGPIIFTPNHQNALMDAMCILCTKNSQPVFVARADIFQKPLIIKILHFLRILPIYRKRDGVNTSDNNQETFDMLLQALHHNRAVGIMPEGTHNETKHLRVLQKGVFRLAMLAQEKYGNRPGIKIIPVGLDYTDTRKYRSDITINYGKAIEMSDYYDLYVENPAKAFRLLQDILSEKMKEGMIDIENEEFYNEIERISVFYEKQAVQQLGLNFRKAIDRLHARQKTIAAMQDFAEKDHVAMAGLCLQIKEYVAILEKHNIRDWVVERQPYSFAGIFLRALLSFFGIPFWILGMLFNYLPYKLCDLGSRAVKDPQFISSVQYVLSMVFFPIYYLVMIVLFVVFIPCIWGKLVMIGLLIPLGLFDFEFYLSIKKLDARFRFWNGKRKQNPDLFKAIELRKSIFEKLDGMTNN